MVLGAKQWAMVFALSSLLLLSISASSLLSSEPHPDTFLSPPENQRALSDHVLLIVLDGVPRSVFDDAEVMPFLSEYDDFGVKINVRTSPLTLTGACVKEMATGRNSSPIDAILNWEVTNEIREDPFYYAAVRGQSVAFTGFYVWENLYPEPYFTHQTSPDYGFSDISLADEDALNYVGEWISTPQHNLMVAHLGGPDHAAHIHGLDSEIYKQRMKELDHQLETLFKTAPDDWTILLTSDHGVTESGGHALGTGVKAEEVYLFAHGRGIGDAGMLNGEIQQRDISLLIAGLMNLPLSTATDARIPLQMLDLEPQEARQMEDWNWENVRMHHQWRDAEGLSAQKYLPAKADWKLLNQNSQTFPWIQFLISIAVIGFFARLLFLSKMVARLTVETSKVQWISAGGFLVLFGASLFFAQEDTFFFISSRWLRKLLGIFPIFLTLLFLIGRHARGSGKKAHSLPVLAIVIGGCLFFFPETRYSMLLITASSLGLYLLRKKLLPSITPTERYTLGAILFLVVFQLIDYLPRFIFGTSLHGLLAIEMLYKPMQRLIAMTSTFNPVSLFLFLIVACFVLWSEENEDGRTVEWKSIGTIALVYILAVIQTTFSDWLLILALLASLLSPHIFANTNALELNTGLKREELLLIGWVGPTWGFYPALSVFFLLKILPKVHFDLSRYLSGEQDSVFAIPHVQRMCYALFGASFVYLTWHNFSLLTTLGLLEYNPSKIIVTGGFFGGRVDPSIAWMGFMIMGPPLFAVGLVLHRLAGLQSLPDILLLFSLILLSVASIYWSSFLRIEYFVMLSTSGLFYILVLGIGFILTLKKPAIDVHELGSSALQ